MPITINDVHQRYSQGRYENQLDNPSKPVMPDLLRKKASDLTVAEAKELPGVIEAHESAKRLYEAGKRAYREENANAEKRLQADLEEAYGLTGHPMAEKVWTLSKQYTSGESIEIRIDTYGELAELVNGRA